MSLSLKRQNTYRRRYSLMTPGWQPATNLYESLIRQFIEPGDTLLDLGCGRGGVLEQLTDVPLHVVGIDPDPVSLMEHRLPKLPRAVADASAIPLPSNSCDMVISAWVMEHLANPAQTLCEVARVLKPGGVFICLTPNKHSPIALLNRLLKPLQHILVPLLYGRAEEDTFPVVYRANTPEDIVQLAYDAGLRPRATFLNPDPTYLAFNELFFLMNVALTRWLPARMGVHLLAVCDKKATKPYWETE
jgi:ubiquinone/menaquinone biosynthesis C-methylase UbiE